MRDNLVNAAVVRPPLGLAGLVSVELATERRVACLPDDHPLAAREVGYVMSEGGGWITILTSGSHQIVRFSDSAAKSFVVCERGPVGGWSDAANATTLWQEVTKPRFLSFLHAAPNAQCPPLSGG